MPTPFRAFQPQSFNFNSRGIRPIFHKRPAEKAGGRSHAAQRNGSEAAYFELLAKQSADAQTREHFQEVADTYRSLPAVGGLNMVRQWQHRAEECRTLAGHFQNSHCKDQLARLADTYDDLARWAGTEGSGLLNSRG
jgi:hypothetical protein